MKKSIFWGCTLALLVVFLSGAANAYRGWLGNEQYSHEPVLNQGTSQSIITGIKGQYFDGRFHGYKIACKLYCRDCGCYTPAVADQLLYPQSPPAFQAVVEVKCKKCGQLLEEGIEW